MALFLWFLLGIAIIFGISRYNESNKLFWTLFISFVGMFTVGKVAAAIIGDNNKGNKVHSTQVCPIHAPSQSLSITSFVTDALNAAAYEQKCSEHVGKVYTPAYSAVYFIPSEVYVEARGQPTSIPENPDIDIGFFDTS